MAQTVLLTGAEGFVGRALARRLSVVPGLRLLRAGHERAAGEAHCRSAAPPLDLHLELRSESSARQVAGWNADTVIHAAGCTPATGADAATMDAVNHLGAERLARHSIRGGLRCFVFLSTVFAHGDDSAACPGGVFTAATPESPTTAYARSKQQGEHRARALCAAAGVRCVILRPAPLYGPGMKGNMLRLLRAIDRGWPLPLAACRNRRSILFIDNLVDVVMRLLAEEEASAEDDARQDVWLLSDHTVAVADLARDMAAALGRPCRLLFAPRPLLRLAAKWSGGRLDIGGLTRTLVVRDEAVTTALGWRPAVSYQEGLRRLAAWYRAQAAAVDGRD